MEEFHKRAAKGEAPIAALAEALVPSADVDDVNREQETVAEARLLIESRPGTSVRAAHEGSAAGGTGIGMYKGSIYAEINDRIVRYALPANSIVPRDAPETIVSGLPLGGDHPMHPFIIDAEGWMYVDVATATNSCQPQNRQPQSPGANPCTELETRGGIWRYNANKTNQTFSPAARYVRASPQRLLTRLDQGSLAGGAG